MAGYLRRFAKDQKYQGKSEVITARIPRELYDEFAKYCTSLGLSISEAIFRLIEKEMNEEKKDQGIVYDRIQSDGSMIIKSIQEQSATLTDEYIPPKSPTVRKRASSGGNKKNANRWKVNNKLPCPKCGRWGSATNFKRDHIEAHGLDYPDAPTYLEAHAEEADRMVEEYKRQLGLE